MARLLLIRHARSEWNDAGRWQGTADPGLSEGGREQAAAAVSRLQGAVELVVSSPQLRARQTAEIISRGLGLGDVISEPGLVEIDVGAFTGLTIKEVQERYPAELTAWRDGTASSAPGGEHREIFLRRIVSAIGRLTEEHDGRPVLVVTHGGVIGRLERHIGAFPGRSVSQLEGRWFTWDGQAVSAASERIAFGGEPAARAEARDEVR